MIQINDVALPAPASLSVQIIPQAGTAQYNTLGQLVQDGMKEKRTVEISWTRMPGDTLAALSGVLEAGGFFTVVYPDPLSGQRRMTARITDRFARVSRYQAQEIQWADVRLTLEEQ